ncbi:hypothetical protein ACN28O_03115 [Xylella fastidiosa subsp. multiplex]|uniref:hypothetical protein n=1 Tax=Xylella fastidiosa TaxID=2371 RepID=UPI003AFB03DD
MRGRGAACTARRARTGRLLVGVATGDCGCGGLRVGGVAPKPEPVKPQQAQVPTVQDGQAVKHHFGTVWVGDEFILAWKMQGTIPIKTKGGKK